MGHAILSPSARVRWGKCPGSVRESAKYPEPESGEAARQGTHTHTLLNDCINKGMVEPTIGASLMDHDGFFTVDSDRAERVSFALKYLRQRYSEIPNCAIVSEKVVDPAPLLGRDDLKGTMDVQLIGDDFLEVVDYKDGTQKVFAQDNPQMEQYAAGVLAEHKDDMSKFKTVRLTIVQPKTRMFGGTGVESYDYSLDDILARIWDIQTEAAATDAPDAPLVPGDEQCKYCPAKGGCVAKVSTAMTSVGLTFANLTQEAANTDPNKMSDEQLAKIIEAAPSIRSMIDSAELEALARMKLGHTLPGLKLIRGRSGNKKWTHSDEEMAKKLSMMKVPKDALWKQTLITPSQLLEKNGTWLNRKGESILLSERQIATLTKDYISKSEGALKVVPESTEGTPVTFSVASSFTAIPAPVELPDWLKPLTN